jgi:histidine triad (HIT) family protein
MDCVFCSIVAGDTAADVVLDEPGLVGFLDRRPVFKGHVLLVPRAHVPTLLDLPPDLHAPLLGAARRLAGAAVAGLGAQGSFVAMNNVVSQSVPHLHVHVVPRTKGDGLRGFFWPRTRYASPEEAALYAGRIRAALAAPEVPEATDVRASADAADTPDAPVARAGAEDPS